MPISNFRLEVTLNSPVILNGYGTLESLLAAAAFQKTGLIQDNALAHVPIEHVKTSMGPIWLASAFLFGSQPKVVPHTVIRRRRRDEIGPAFYDGNPRLRRDPYAVEQDRGDFCALLNTYRTYQADALVWYAKGDAQACAELLASLFYIGKRRNEGFGELGEITIQSVANSVLSSADGSVTRPIPLQLLPELYKFGIAESQRVEMTSWSHPAWLANSCECAVPTSRVDGGEKLNAVLGDDNEEFFG